MISKYYQGCLFVVLSAVIFGCTPLSAKFIYQGGCNAISLVLYRYLLALPVLFILVRRNKSITMHISKAELKKMVLLASIGAALMPMLLFSSYNHISSGTATTIHFIYPIFVLIGCALFFGDRITSVKAVCVLLCTVGIVLFYTPGQQENLIGIVLAFASGIAYSFYIIYLDKSLLKEMNPFKLSFYSAVICSMLLLAYFAVTGTLTIHLTPKAWILALVFSLSLTVGAVVLFQLGVSIIGSQRASILSTFEPITSIIVGIIVFHEVFNAKIAVGVILILTSVLLLTLFDKETST